MTGIKINNLNINYNIEGNGFPIVFIHGLSDNLSYWEPLVNEFRNSYKTIRYDLRGHGKSDNGDEDPSIELYEEDLCNLLKELNIKKAIFVGLSLGGNIALEIATNHSEMVAGLVIMSSYSETSHKLKRIFKEFENAIKINYEEFFDRILPYTMPEDLIKEYENELKSLKEELAEVQNCQGILNGIHAGKEFFITNKLRKIETPTLIIAGSDDELTSPHTQKKIVKNIKNSEYVELENTKHNILLPGNIPKVIRILKDFFDKIE